MLPVRSTTGVRSRQHGCCYKRRKHGLRMRLALTDMKNRCEFRGSSTVRRGNCVFVPLLTRGLLRCSSPQKRSPTEKTSLNAYWLAHFKVPHFQTTQKGYTR